MSSVVKTGKSFATENHGISFVKITKSGRMIVPIKRRDSRVVTKGEAEKATVREEGGKGREEEEEEEEEDDEEEEEEEEEGF